MKTFIYSILLLLVTLSPALAQDPQYSQFFAAPLHISPAFAGSALAPRVIANYRNQWPGQEANYVTYSVSADHYLDKINSGIGLVISNDVQRYGQLRSTDVGLQYAYQLELTRELAFRAGLQASYVNRNIGFNNLRFTDQYDNTGYTGGANGETGEESIGYADLSAGGLLFSKKYYIGYSAHHMNRPNQSFLGTDHESARLPMKHTVTAGMKIPLNDKTRRGLQRGFLDREVSLSPVLLYKKQGPFDQMDAGIYLTYEPLVVGAWYRGLPIKKFSPQYANNDALIFLVGFHMSSFAVGYSYDVTVSRLTPSSGGAHEISLTYTFLDAGSKKNIFRKGRSLPCPRF
jgi:type IX secretion system PorP/SprF family membrane protein